MAKSSSYTLQSETDSPYKVFKMTKKNQELAIFEIEENNTPIDARLNDETVWLNLNQLSQLFERDKSVISRHLKEYFSRRIR